jgi:hypothetical protein
MENEVHTDVHDGTLGLAYSSDQSLPGGGREREGTSHNSEPVAQSSNPNRVQEAWLAKLGHWTEALEKYDARLEVNADDADAIRGM